MKEQPKFEAPKDKGRERSSEEDVQDFESEEGSEKEIHDILADYEKKFEEKGLFSIRDAIYDVYESLKDDFYEKQQERGSEPSVLNAEDVYRIDHYFKNNEESREIRHELFENDVVENFGNTMEVRQVNQFIEAELGGDEGWFYYLVREQAIELAKEKGLINSQEEELFENYYTTQGVSQLRHFMAADSFRNLEAVERLSENDNEDLQEARLLCDIQSELAITTARPPRLNLPFTREDIESLLEWSKKNENPIEQLHFEIRDYKKCVNELYRHKILSETSSPRTLNQINEYPTDISALDNRLQKIEKGRPSIYEENLSGDYTHGIHAGLHGVTDDKETILFSLKKYLDDWGMDSEKLENYIENNYQ